eukprot:CAMPEP_0175936374 /NCGR_PEP_ID=MMETSP0108-20121206/21573_1 /TAXON_ID=195067 ORGANISM="Goniomonas pacifica, Strain CCMP1869" /NCGR_SAMPLE_ID=MMETSP0108 /ASSEMBLY_ACC=CAM_ASM_000204 /LENGTH=78 /DNA_ID=CAMNT_0017260443 /DNA_START=699 /DNA_END=935 /DNA_ORIENTATION=+
MLSNLPRSSSSVVPYHVPVSTKCLMPNSAATLAMTAALVGSSMASASDLPSNDWIYWLTHCLTLSSDASVKRDIMEWE